MKLDIKNEPGFSLIELVITIVIIGILSITIALRFNLLSDETKATACRANQRALETAQTSYFVTIALARGANGEYASDIEDLTPFLTGGKTPECPKGGSYILHTNGNVTCSLPFHNM